MKRLLHEVRAQETLTAAEALGASNYGDHVDEGGQSKQREHLSDRRKAVFLSPFRKNFSFYCRVVYTCGHRGAAETRTRAGEDR